MIKRLAVVIDVTARAQDEGDTRQLPELMGTAEVATFLRVTSTRVGQLRNRPDFPAPAYSHLSCGLLWLAEQIRAFDASWDRSRQPGRPRKHRESPAVAGQE